MIQLKNICAGYDGEEVLHNVSMGFKPGKVTILVGPNGCGKSTLLKTIVRLNPHSSGQILINGEDIDSYTSATLAQQVAFLPQAEMYRTFRHCVWYFMDASHISNIREDTEKKILRKQERLLNG